MPRVGTAKQVGKLRPQTANSSHLSHEVNLRIFRPPFSLRSAHDILGDKTSEMFSIAGIPCVSRDLWPEFPAALMHSGRIPFGVRSFAKFLAPAFANRSMRHVTSGDLFWILGAAVPRQRMAQQERKLKNRGAGYIFHIMDDWLEVEYLREATLQRAELADLIVVPTPVLQDKISRHFPFKKVLSLEEPIDINRVYPKQNPASAARQSPVIVWTGNPSNLDLLRPITRALEIISNKHPFTLRIISKKPPKFSFPFPMEWKKYDFHKESDLLSGASIGLAPLHDSPYARAKGIYKVKTYLAAGIIPIGPPIGYLNHLIQHGENGMLCSSEEEWVDNITYLLTNQEARRQMALKARQSAIEKYSHAAVSPQWVAAIKNNF
jgi:glycosyltransferase involved in cell wall biosynthesis